MLNRAVLECDVCGRRMRIPYWVRPGGLAVLYLHGMGCSSSDWIAAVDRPEFAANALVGFEAPGTDTSVCDSPETLGVDDIAVVAEYLIQALDIAPVSLVGHSMGGLASLLLACARPDLVACFVNIEGNLTADDCGLSRIAVNYPTDVVDGSFFDSLERQVRGTGRLGYAEYADRFRHNLSEPAYRSYSRSLVRHSDHGDLLHRFLALDIPRLFVHGAETTGLSYLDVLRLHGVELAAIPDSDHFPSYSNPAQLFIAVADFVARHAKPTVG